MTWTHFMDMHSGGGTKEGDYEDIYIEAPEDEAVVIFYNRFGHNPNRITCTCCGEDYSISEYPTLEEASAYQRDGRTLEEYAALPYILIMSDGVILPEERKGTVPRNPS